MALVALLLLVLAAPVLGWLCGQRVDDALQESARAQHAARQLTTAVVVRQVPARQVATDPEVSPGRTGRTPVVARWHGADGTAHSATVTTASRDTADGARVRIWTDLAGNPAPRPLDAPTAHTHAALAGCGVALLSVLVIEGGRRLIVWRMVQRRYERLDRAWAGTGPDWGRTGTGS